jgi:hypothetical protein
MRREKHHGIADNDDIDDVGDFDYIYGTGPMRASGDRPMAVVLGARVIEVVRSLAMEGIPVGLVTPTGDPARWSRCARNVMTWDWMMPAYRHDDALADRLVAFARQQAVPPVLMYCSLQGAVRGPRRRALAPCAADGRPRPVAAGAAR